MSRKTRVQGLHNASQCSVRRNKVKIASWHKFQLFLPTDFFSQTFGQFYPPNQFFQGQSDKNWFRKLGRTRVMQHCISCRVDESKVPPRSGKTKRSGVPRTHQTNYVHDLSKYHAITLKTTNTQDNSNGSLGHKLTQSNTNTLQTALHACTRLKPTFIFSQKI